MGCTAPNRGVIKLNTDAAMFNNSATLAVIARDDNLKAWSKNVLISDYFMAEAATIFWALELAKADEQYCKNVCPEGDSKICFALNGASKF